jgi:hypothetical protein
MFRSPPPGKLPRGSRKAHAAFLTVIGVLLVLACSSPLVSARLTVGHRLFPEFREEHTVAPGETFQLGDTDYSGRIVGVIKDFAIDDSTKRVFSRTEEPRNPALRIRIFEDGRTVEEVWAFGGEGPPHFARSSELYFHIDSLRWKDSKD